MLKSTFDTSTSGQQQHLDLTVEGGRRRGKEYSGVKCDLHYNLPSLHVGDAFLEEEKEPVGKFVGCNVSNALVELLKTATKRPQRSGMFSMQSVSPRTMQADGSCSD